jgi:hypothetical protein
VRKRTDNLEAYDYFLRGVEYRNRLTKETNVQARQMWEKAVELDPQYAEAYAALGGPTGRSGSGNGIRTPRTWSERLRWRKKPLLWMTPCPWPTDY